MDSLVSTQWLADQLGSPGLRILDATWFLPDAGRDARAEFEDGHIPGAMFFDIDLMSDKTSTLPTMLPPAVQFAAQLGALGMNDGDRIVLYDNAAHHTAARAWWMLRSIGVDAALLDGGLAKWTAEGRQVERGTQPVEPGQVTPRFNPALVRSLDQVRANLISHAEQLVDARSPARFTGQEPETRPGLASGHIPGSANVPYSSFFNPDGTWKHTASLRLVLEDEGVEIERPVIATCGSGISAAVVVFALHLLGHPAALYDGSWTEWGADPTTPKATGAA
ncbi:3-mercaptopyruvate sulfurtransferase [Sphingomonas turrisvirgatae]|uniref:Sulfurtransferase n=1 Tax=Sphingomonas turrisvirgatae TaxID=1888892 RepID=A0A1E3LWJ2_9SPHN|nr:3-mercaptopyruvate sulfurtransferase [Sphingomonas turrisvirgatae]ODP38088.1 3-mercaptopyruvate sulfurtransferase [Sphingomonas turrisvirgatae]